MKQQSNINFFAYLFILLGIFIIIIFTMNMYFDLMKNRAETISLDKKISEKKASIAKMVKEIDKLNNNPDSEENKKIKKYNIDFREDEILSYFYNYAKDEKNGISIQSITLDKGKVNDFGLTQGNINLQANFSNEGKMIDFLNHINNDDNDYALFLHELSYPFLDANSGEQFSVSLPLMILYK